VSRYVAIFTAAILILLETKSLIGNYRLPDNEPLQDKWWPAAIIVMCFGIILSHTLSNLLSLLLLLPILESAGNHHLFSFSLRYALPIILSLWLNVFIFLGGVILYSMLVYPSLMFESFTRSFFSYIYNNFQYATYEIFL
jgi:hypothetical protein